MPVAGLSFAALQSLTLLQIRDRLCRYLRATLCHVSELSSAGFHSSVLPAFTAQLCWLSQLSSASVQSLAMLESRAMQCQMLTAIRLLMLMIIHINVTHHSNLPTTADCTMLMHWWTIGSDLCSVPSYLVAPCDSSLQTESSSYSSKSS